MVLQSTAVSISVSGSGFTVTWSGSGATDLWAIYIYKSTTAAGTYTLLTSDSFSTASGTSGTHLVSYSPTGTYFYRAVVTSGGGTAAEGTSQSLCAPVLYPSSGTPSCSTINLTMSCLSTIFSGYGGGARGYSLQSYSSIMFYDGSNGPTVPPISMSSFLGQSAYNSGGVSTFSAVGSFTFTVPTGVSTIGVVLRGAIGGTSGASPGVGGAGGKVSGTLVVTPNEILGILVNQDGGAGGASNAGGGRAAIQRAGVDVVTAGGGGGAASMPPAGGNGGAGGGTTGGIGGSASGGAGGGGGTQSAPGTGGVGSNTNGGDGSGYIGGSGVGNGGGGGGGYYGGGGGGVSNGQPRSGGGGGGSSYIANLTGTVVNTQSDNTTISNGDVKLIWTAGGGGGGGGGGPGA